MTKSTDERLSRTVSFRLNDVDMAKLIRKARPLGPTRFARKATLAMLEPERRLAGKGRGG